VGTAVSCSALTRCVDVVEPPEPKAVGSNPPGRTNLLDSFQKSKIRSSVLGRQRSSFSAWQGFAWQTAWHPMLGRRRPAVPVILAAVRPPILGMNCCRNRSNSPWDRTCCFSPASNGAAVLSNSVSHGGPSSILVCSRMPAAAPTNITTLTIEHRRGIELRNPRTGQHVAWQATASSDRRELNPAYRFEGNQEGRPIAADPGKPGSVFFFDGSALCNEPRFRESVAHSLHIPPGHLRPPTAGRTRAA
jgi:hypothetical protein